MQFSKDTSRPLTKFHSPPPFVSCPISSFLRSVDCFAFVSNTFSCALSLYMNCNLKTKWQSCQPISHLKFLNSLFGCLVVGCLRGQYRGTKECHKVASPKSSVVFGRLEATWASVEDDHTKGIPCPYPNHEKKQVALIVENQSRTGQANWTSCFCPHGPKAFGSSCVSPKTSS